MKLLADEWQGVYVWVDDMDENIDLSPRFDYEDDALAWRDRMLQEMIGQLYDKPKTST